MGKWPRIITFEPLNEAEIWQLAGSIATGWVKYVELFGEAPHGTEQQIAALLELSPGVRAKEQSR